MRSGRILVVDDEVNARTALAELLRDEGFDVETAADAFKALGKYETFTPHVVVTDLKMPGMDGIELVKKIRAFEDPAAVVVMTAFGAVASAVDAMRAGAADYLTKPLNFDELLVVLDKVLDEQALRRETRQLRVRVRDRVAPNNIVGMSPPMQRVFEVVDQVAPSRATVLITGESGTGKELVANALHQRSNRSNGPFVKLHCAALAESLLESELFGHEKGAFTGAVAAKPGLLEAATGGTLFLDEVGELSLSAQAKLLRCLDSGMVLRVGATKARPIDVRFVSATNRDLVDEVTRGSFRSDLYYRIAGVTVLVPPLRQRALEIPILARRFCVEAAGDLGRSAAPVLSDEVNDLLVRYEWPGNVRELRNVMHRALLLCSGETLELRHLPARITHPVDLARASATSFEHIPTMLPKASAPAAGWAEAAPANPPSHLLELAHQEILDSLTKSGGNQTEAARLLGISRVTLAKRLEQYGIPRPRKR